MDNDKTGPTFLKKKLGKEIFIILHRNFQKLNGGRLFVVKRMSGKWGAFKSEIGRV